MLDATPVTSAITRLISTGTTEQALLAAVASRFATIKMPAAMPDAGQNTATSDGVDSKASPNRAAK
jgi:hypothetical protein